MAESRIIETRGLSKCFGRQEAVQDLDLAVRQGEIFGLLGPDGAGKTTTLRLLCGLMSPTSGQAFVAGYDTLRQTKHIKRVSGYMPQHFSLYNDLTVMENINFYADIYDLRQPARRERIDRLLHSARLSEFTRRRAGQLSGGMKQKLALACTLLHSPPILLLDEPTTGVDPVSRREFWDILTEVHLEGVTLFITTPYMDEAERCSRLGLVYRGRLIVCDTPAAIKDMIEGEVIELRVDRFRQAANALAGLEAAEAELAQILADPRPAEIRRAEAEVHLAETRASGAKAMWEDALRLRDNPLELDAQIHRAGEEARLAALQIDLARAELSEAQVRYEASKGGGSDIEKTTTQILQQYVEIAEENLKLAERTAAGSGETLAQLRRLREEPAELDANVNNAEMRYRMLEGEVLVQRAGLALAKAGPRPEEVALAQSKVELARREVEKLHTLQERLVLKARMAGSVSGINIHPGEIAIPGAPLLTISDLSTVELTVFIPLSKLGGVWLGQPASVSVDAYPDRAFEGKVVRIAEEAEFTPRNVQSGEDRANIVFAVKIQIENPQELLKPGMTAEAALDSRGR